MGGSSLSRGEWVRQALVVVSFFFAVASLVPTASGRMFVVWPALSPEGAVIAVLSTWFALRTAVMRNDPLLRWVSGATLVLWTPFWSDVVPLVLSDPRGPWKMVVEGIGGWFG